MINGKTAKRVFHSLANGGELVQDSTNERIKYWSKVIFISEGIDPDGSKISNESNYLYGENSKIRKLYGEIPKVNGNPLVFLDSLKGEAINAFVKARIFYAVMDSMKLRPHEWGLKNEPTGNLQINLDFEELVQITSGLDLIAEWYASLGPSGNKDRLGKLENFFERISKVSYYREAKFFWSLLEAIT